MHDELFVYRVAHHGYLLTSCPGQEKLCLKQKNISELMVFKLSLQLERYKKFKIKIITIEFVAVRTYTQNKNISLVN